MYRTLSHPEVDGGIPEFVLNEFREMVATLKRSVECPVCFDEMEADDIKFSNCGHKYCESCLARLDTCAICRKPIKQTTKRGRSD